MCVTLSSVKRSQSPVASTQQAARRVVLSTCCVITTPGSLYCISVYVTLAHSTVFPGQPVTTARQGCLLGIHRETSHRMIDWPCTTAWLREIVSLSVLFHIWCSLVHDIPILRAEKS